MTPDHINAALELGGAIFSAMSIRVLIRDRIVRGFSWYAVAYFTAWGAWNLWYYPHLQQPLSAIAALALVIVNATWLTLALCFHLRMMRLTQTGDVLPITTRRSQAVRREATR